MSEVTHLDDVAGVYEDTATEFDAEFETLPPVLPYPTFADKCAVMTDEEVSRMNLHYDALIREIARMFGDVEDPNARRIGEIQRKALINWKSGFNRTVNRLRP